MTPPPLTKRAARALPTATDTPLFRRQKHIQYWLRCLRSPLPPPYTSNDSNRMTLAFFTVSALDLLGVLFTATTKDERDAYIAWIYGRQHRHGGFRGWSGGEMGERAEEGSEVWDPANVPATYFALAALCVLRDDLSRVDRRGCLSWLRRMQRADGSFGQTLGQGDVVEGGMDTRFGYCAMVTRWILRGDMQGEVEGVPDVDVEALVRCIAGSETYDGGMSDMPFHEAHAGFTYCALGALHMTGNLSYPRSARPASPTEDPSKTYAPVDPNMTTRWLLSRLTDWVEEEPEDDDESVDDVDTHSNGSVPTALDSNQTPGTSFGTDGIQNSTTEQSKTTPPKAFEKFGSHPISTNTTPPLPVPDLSEASNVVHASSPPPLDDTSELEQVQWVGCAGRANKLADTCYVFWVGGSLNILHSQHLIDPGPVRRYLLEKTQHLIVGGFGKHTGALPDIFHAYLGLSALALLGVDDSDSLSADAHAGAAPVDTPHVGDVSRRGDQQTKGPSCHLTEPSSFDIPPELSARGGTWRNQASNGNTDALALQADVVRSGTEEAPGPHSAHPPQPPAVPHTERSSQVSEPPPTDHQIEQPTPFIPHSTRHPSNHLLWDEMPRGLEMLPAPDVVPTADRIGDESSDHDRVLRRLDAALCVSEETRAFIEGLAWRTERMRRVS